MGYSKGCPFSSFVTSVVDIFQKMGSYEQVAQTVSALSRAYRLSGFGAFGFDAFYISLLNKLSIMHRL